MKKGNFDAFFRDKYLTKNNARILMLINWKEVFTTTQHADSYLYGKEAPMVDKCIVVQKYYGILTIY